MSFTLRQACNESLRNLRRAIDLLNLVEGNALTKPSDVPWLHGARAKLFIACTLLEEAAYQPGTLTSVSELIFKAELYLASMDLRVNELSMRVADALLLQTRVKLESCGQTSARVTPTATVELKSNDTRHFTASLVDVTSTIPTTRRRP